MKGRKSAVQIKNKQVKRARRTTHTNDKEPTGNPMESHSRLLRMQGKCG